MDAHVAALLHYYAREGLAHHVQAVCDEELRAGAGPNPVLQLWRAYGLLDANQSTEASVVCWN